MDLLALLEDKLRFLWWFYEKAAEPFTEMLRKIEAGEEPYVDRRDPEWADEPAFIEEHGRAHDALDVLGHSCLSMLQSFVKEYLEGYVKRLGADPTAVQKRGNGWFEHYRLYFKGELGVDWICSPVDLRIIEQINIARNDIQHGGEAYTLAKRQNQEHHKRFPDGIFANESDKRLNEKVANVAGLEPPYDATWPARIEVSKEKLITALEAVHQFCAFVEGGCEEGRLAVSSIFPWSAPWPLPAEVASPVQQPETDS